MEKNILISLLSAILLYIAVSLLYLKNKHTKVHRQVYMSLNIDNGLYTDIADRHTKLKIMDKLLLKRIHVEERRLNLSIAFYTVSGSESSKKRVTKHYITLHRLRKQLDDHSHTIMNIDKLNEHYDSCNVCDTIHGAKHRSDKISRILKDLDKQLTHKR